MQLNYLNIEEIKTKKRYRNKIPTYTKNNSIHKIIEELNTIPHIYRLKSLYSIYSRLFMLTYNKKLACLNYYIEDDNFMYAEIDGAEKLEIKERIIVHINLLRKVLANDPTLEYDEKIIDSETQTDEGQLSLFG